MKKVKTNYISSQKDIDWEAQTARIIKWIIESGAMVAYIDLFCGMGGTTSGVKRAEFLKKVMGIVILGINHDDVALAIHAIDNPNTLHLKEDIRDVNLIPIMKMIADIRKACPWIKIFLWSSAECTHHSKAKGGASRDPDSRSLAEELYRYEQAIQPDLIQVENVVEFRHWGPLEQKIIRMRKSPGKIWKHRKKTKYGLLISKNEKTWVDPASGLAYRREKNKTIEPWMIPIQSRKAEYFNAWKERLINSGYKYEDKNINSADHGAYTSRTRYYGQFSKKLNIVWPEATHTKDPEKHFQKTGIRLLKHKPVRDVLDLNNTGESIFRKKRIADKTYKRLYEWLIKEEHKGPDRFDRFISAYHGNGTNCRSVNDPSTVIPTKDSVALVTPFIMRDFSRTTNTGLDKPIGALTAIPKANLAQCQYSEFHLMNLYQYGGKGSRSVDDSCFTLIARMDKAPPYLLGIEGGKLVIKIQKGDTKHMILIKNFMNANGIIDIKMRMLKEEELLPIQGFEPDQIERARRAGIRVTVENAKKYIGNSQEVNTAKCILEAYGPQIHDEYENYLKNAA